MLIDLHVDPSQSALEKFAWHTVMSLLHRLVIFTPFIIPFFIVGIDILGKQFPATHHFSLAAWYISFLFIGLFAMETMIRLIRSFFRRSLVFTPLILLMFFALVLFNSGKDINVNGETTQEIGCVLRHLEEGTVQNGTCLFGYPARQYLVPAVPSLLFGRTATSLNVGGALYFLVGIIIFAGGAIRYLVPSRKADLLVATVLLFLLHSRFFNWFLFYFEQSIFPLSFALMVVGLFLQFRSDNSVRSIGLMGTLLFYAIHSYTPGLALYGLMVVTALYLVAGKVVQKKMSLYVLVTVFISMISLFHTFEHRTDINILEPGRERGLAATDIRQGLYQSFIYNDGTPILSAVVRPLFFLSVAASITFIFGWRMAMLAAWIVGVILMAVLSKGYTFYGIDFRLHRSIVVLPVWMGMIVFILNRSFFKRVSTTLLTVVFVFLIVVGLHFYSRISHEKKVIHPRNELYVRTIQWFGDSVQKHSTQHSNAVLFIAPSLGKTYASVSDMLQYFLPEVSSEIMLNNCEIRYSNSEYTSYMVAESSDVFCPGVEFVYVSDFYSSKHNISLFLYHIKQSSSLEVYDSSR